MASSEMPRGIRRHWLRVIIASLLSLVSGISVSTWSDATTPAVAVPALYAFATTNTGPLPYDATPLLGATSTVHVLGNPQCATDPTGLQQIIFRTDQQHVVLLTPSTGQLLDLTTLVKIPLAGGDPTVAYDSAGNTFVTYLTPEGHLVEVDTALQSTTIMAHQRVGWAEPAWHFRDLSKITKDVFHGPITSLYHDGRVDLVAATSDAQIFFSLSIGATFTLRRVDLSVAATIPSNAVSLTLVPTLSDEVETLFYVDPSSHLIMLRAAGHSAGGWVATDLSATTAIPSLPGSFSVASSVTGFTIANLTTSGDVQLSTGVLSNGTFNWTSADISLSLPSAPQLTGTLFVNNSGSTLTVAGQANSWGDLFVYSKGAGGSWTSVDASATGGSNAKTITNYVTGFGVNGKVTLVALGVATPAPNGTGVYAIPSSKWSQAIRDGWPIVTGTGALGTTSAPWIGLPRGVSVAQSPDYQLGQTLAASRKRTTWLSFWTASGPLSGEAKTAATYYAHGRAAGVWVAQQIDSYRSLGLGLKPDWVIFDPEGYPDNHSGLDGSVTTAASLAFWVANWKSILSGWSDGIASVDSSLKAGVYASQSEYRNYSLASQPLPVFIAVAFGWGDAVTTAASLPSASTISLSSNHYFNAGQSLAISDGANSEQATIAANYNGVSLNVPLTRPLSKAHARGVAVASMIPPKRIAGSYGSNVRGFISFSDRCVLLSQQMATLTSPPFSGIFNTLQFDAGTYCPPTTP